MAADVARKRVSVKVGANEIYGDGTPRRLFGRRAVGGHEEGQAHTGQRIIAEPGQPTDFGPFGLAFLLRDSEEDYTAAEAANAWAIGCAAVLVSSSPAVVHKMSSFLILLMLRFFQFSRNLVIPFAIILFKSNRLICVRQKCSGGMNLTVLMPVN